MLTQFECLNTLIVVEGHHMHSGITESKPTIVHINCSRPNPQLSTSDTCLIIELDTKPVEFGPSQMFTYYRLLYIASIIQ